MKVMGAVLAFWLLVVVSGVFVQTEHDRLFVKAEEAREPGDVLLDVFGEFRTVLARYLWFKMDLFHEVLDDEGVPEEKQAEVMPLLRMVSLLDPTITDSYDNIAWDLYKGHGRIDEAIEVVQEGLKRNPTSLQLELRLAMLYYADKKFELSEREGVKAAALAVDTIDVLNATRLIYWSAKRLGHMDAARSALDRLIVLRPTDKLWTTEKAALDKRP